jgi:hypothetical protein
VICLKWSWEKHKLYCPLRYLTDLWFFPPLCSIAFARDLIPDQILTVMASHPWRKWINHLLLLNSAVQQTTFSWMVNSWPVVKYSLIQQYNMRFNNLSQKALIPAHLHLANSEVVSDLFTLYCPLRYLTDLWFFPPLCSIAFARDLIPDQMLKVKASQPWRKWINYFLLQLAK